MVRRRALWLPLLLVLLLVLLHGGCGGVVAGWDEGQVVEVDDEDRELSFAEMEERDLPGEDAVPAETFLEQQMCRESRGSPPLPPGPRSQSLCASSPVRAVSAQDTAAAKESDHATRQKLQFCLPLSSGFSSCPSVASARPSSEPRTLLCWGRAGSA